jgi:hypothetical protein
MTSNPGQRPKLRAVIVVAVVALLSLSLVAEGTSAKGKNSSKIKSSVKVSLIAVDGPPFGQYNAVGTVSSPKAGCRARKISLVDQEGTVLGRGTSDSSGNFTVGPFTPHFVDTNVYALKKKLGRKTCIRSGKDVNIPGS